MHFYAAAAAPASMAPAAFSAAVGDLMRTQPTAAAQTRLLVKCDGRLQPQGATDAFHGGNGLWVLQFDSAAAAQAAFDYYQTLRDVRYVEFDQPISMEQEPQPAPTPAKRAFGQTQQSAYGSSHLSWGPAYIGMDDLTEGMYHGAALPPEKVVAVIDSGVESGHTFFQGRVQPTTVNTSDSGTPNSSEDDNGHGTAAAGIILDATPGNILVRAYKVLNLYTQGTHLTVAAGIDSAVADAVDVITLSLGFDSDSQVLADAVQNALDHDIPVFAAAGNKASAAPHYPSSYEGVMRISAIGEDGLLASFSNYGNVDLAAPGVNIRTAVLNDRYANRRGTSEATPLAAAVCGVLRAAHPGLTATQATDLLKACAASPRREAPEKYGAGILHAPNLTDPAVRALLIPWLGSADYTDYQAAVDRAAAIEDASIYEKVTVDALNKALAVNVENYTPDDQPTLDLQTARIHAAIDGLVLWTPRTCSIYCATPKVTPLSGTPMHIQVRPVYGSTRSVRWYSVTPHIVTVSTTGYVRFVGAGTGLIKADVTLDDGTKVTVSKEVEAKANEFERFMIAFRDLLREIFGRSK